MALDMGLVLRGTLAATQGPPVVPDGSIGTGKLADGAVTNPKIADGAVIGPKIASKAVTADKMDVSITYTVTDGDLTISLT